MTTESSTEATETQSEISQLVDVLLVFVLRLSRLSLQESNYGYTFSKCFNQFHREMLQRAAVSVSHISLVTCSRRKLVCES